MEERCPRIAVAEECIDKLKVADGHWIELQAVRSLVEPDSVDVIELGLLGVARVMQHSAGSDRRREMSGKSEAVERLCSQLAFKQRNRVIAGKGVGVDGSFRANAAQRLERFSVLGIGEERMGCGVEQFGGFDCRQLFDGLERLPAAR